ncbi:MAG: HDOD domain-containing protein [Pseudomonadota bacterium]
MEAAPRVDIKGEELDQQRFQLLKDIAKDLSDETTFPTCFDLVIRLRKALQDPDQTIDQIAALISLEPLIPLRLIHLANSVLYNRGQEVKDAKSAIQRLGLRNVRSTAMAIAMQQLLSSKGMVVFGDLPQRLWDHSLTSACAAHVLAKRLTRLNVDEAQLAGLVHDLGAFYLFYRFSQYEELRLRPESAKFLVARWHESIGHSLLMALGIPEEIALAMVEHDTPRPLPGAPTSLTDVVYVANMLAGGLSAWLDQGKEGESEEIVVRHARERYAEHLPEIEAYEADMRAMLK